MKKIVLILLVFSSLSIIAQDKIFKIGGSVIDCNVTEVGASEIKYTYKDKPLIVFGVDKALVDRIEFATGEVIKVDGNTFNNEEYYSNQNKRAIKVNFLSPLMGSTEFAYEQSIKPGRSWEAGLGIIGLGFDPQENNPAGAYGKLALKFIKSPDFYTQKMHYSHILKGAYIAPEIAIRYVKFDSFWYNYDYYNYSSTTKREEEFAITFNLKFGKQWVFDDSFLIDTFFGLGYGYTTQEYEGINYGFVVASNDVPISFTGGIRFGWTF